MLTRYVATLLILATGLAGRGSAQTEGDIHLSSACFDSLPYRIALPCDAYSFWKSKVDIGALYTRVNTVLTTDSLAIAIRDSSDTGVALIARPQRPHGECARPAKGPDWISPSIAIHFDAKPRPREDSTGLVVWVQGSAVAVEGNTGGSMVLAMCYLARYKEAIQELAASISRPTDSLLAQHPPSPPAIRTGEWRYLAEAQLGDQRQDLGARTVSIALTDSGDAAAWLVVMSTEVEGHQVTDSVMMRRSDLSPVSRHLIMPGTDLVLAVADSVAHGLLTAQTSVVPLNVRLGPRGFLNYYSLRAALVELPLTAGWAGQASVLEVLAHPVFATLTLSVVGDERITVPAGEFDCWRLKVAGPGIDEEYWVDKGHQDVIRTREPFGPQRVIMQLDLTSFVAHSPARPTHEAPP